MKISKEARRTARQLIRLTVRDGKVNEDTARQIAAKLMAEKPRHYLGILSAWNRLLRLEVEKRHAIVESAVELSDAERKSILSKLKKRHGADVSTEFRVSPGLIGGLRIALGSTVWDGSIRTRLDNFRDALQA